MRNGTNSSENALKSASKTKLVGVAILVIAIVVASAGIGLYVLRGPDGEEPSPTASPTPSPTPIPKEPEILSHSSYIDTIGYYTIVGEVLNNLKSNINYVKIVATFYDSESKVIGTSFTFTELSILKPSQKSPFELSAYPDKINPASYKLTLQYYVTGNQPFEGLTILSHTPSIDGIGYHQIVGEVQNNGNRKTTYTKVVCTYYNSQGTVIATSFTFTDPMDIDVGQAAPFELSSYPNKISPARYELQVEGN